MSTFAIALLITEQMIRSKFGFVIKGQYCLRGTIFERCVRSDHEIGLYPFEPIKDIYGLVQNLFDTTKEEREKVRKQIFALWREARRELLKEFDREVPTFSHSHWLQPDKSQVYNEYQIQKKAA